ncbi:MAG TPA: type II toxin-antitoxin system VapC family toxin, partial [Iamia sp.]
MVIDSSAIVAILRREDTSPALARALEEDELRLLGTPTRTEMSIVVQRSGLRDGVGALKDLLDELGVLDVPFDRGLADLAIEAHARWGRGNHPAKLNIGDCFTYAVAKHTG